MIRRMGSRPMVFSIMTCLLLSGVLVAGNADPAQVAVKQFGQDDAQDEAVAEEEKASVDIENKIDTTIKILQVIKEEVKDIEPDAKTVSASPSGSAVDQGWTENLKNWIRKAARAWRKVREATRPKGAQQEPTDAKQEQEITRDLSEKLDKTMQAMQVIREELDKISEEEK